MKKWVVLLVFMSLQTAQAQVDWGFVSAAVGTKLGLKAVNKYVFQDSSPADQGVYIQNYESNYPAPIQYQPSQVAPLNIPPIQQYQAPPVYSSVPAPYMQRVSPYTRNGYDVQGYYRTPADGYNSNNFSNYRFGQ